jgi:hypothetical protein
MRRSSPSREKIGTYTATMMQTPNTIAGLLRRPLDELDRVAARRCYGRRVRGAERSFRPWPRRRRRSDRSRARQGSSDFVHDCNRHTHAGYDAPSSR